MVYSRARTTQGIKGADQTCRKSVNIKDVARLAGVSPTTVSHALGGQRPVSAATRSACRTAVAELGYRPHPGARSLKASGTGVLALCAVNVTSASLRTPTSSTTSG